MLKKYESLVHIDSHLASHQILNTSDVVACLCLNDFKKKMGQLKFGPRVVFQN